MSIRILSVSVLTLFSFAFHCSHVMAQGQGGKTAKAVTGVVLGSNPDGKTEPLPGATVTWRGTQVGVYTNNLGGFTINRVEGADTLEIRYVAYETTVMIGPADSISVTLVPLTTSEVQVTAEQPTITTAVQKTERISSRDLSKSACCSLAESFEKSPTVEVSFSDAVSGARQIQLLGLSGHYTQFMIDAVPLVRSVELPFGLDHIPGPFMESVSISKGASSVTNGYDGMTGQINIRYKDPWAAPRLHVNAYGNTMQRAELNLVSGQRLSSELATETMVHGRILQNEIDNNGDGFQDIPMFKQLNLVHSWMYADDNYEVHVFGRGILDNYSSGQLTGSLDSNGQRVDPYRISTDIGRLDGYVKLGLLNPFPDMEGSGISLVFGGAMHNQFSAFGERRADSRQRTLQVRGVAALPFSDDFKLVTGFSYLYDNVVESLESNNFKRTENVPGVYAEATLSPLTDITVVAGIRSDWHNLYGTFVSPRVHAKWSISPFSTLRASVGKGYRVPTVISENISAYINSRSLNFDAAFRPEESWNYGFSLTTAAEIASRVLTFDVELYQTNFNNQVIIDFDRSARELWVTNLNGKSIATHAMVQALFSPIPRLDLVAAYRWVDVQAPFNNQMMQKPMISRTRMLFTASYTTVENDWQFDVTVSRNGAGRLPSTAENAEPYVRPSEFPAFWRLNSQVTKKFKDLDVYFGAENLTNFIQSNPIVAAAQPFSPYFDASMTWGSLDPRMFYLGVRYTIN
ncbi:MAG: TonB-dependent receptor [Ignavibacteria bacterium]|nr:TonB-dependent receptor [Ignavibacteria bacterium]